MGSKRSKRKEAMSRSNVTHKVSSRDESPPPPKRLTKSEIQSHPEFEFIDLVDSLTAESVKLVKNAEKFQDFHNMALSTAVNEKEKLQLELKHTKAEMASITLKYHKAIKKLGDIEKRAHLGKGNLGKLVKGKRRKLKKAKQAGKKNPP